MNETQDVNVELVTKSDLLGLNSWDRERTSDELISFISRRESAVSSRVEE